MSEYLAENGINIDGELYCVECYDEDEQNEEEEGADLWKKQNLMKF